MTAEYTDLVKAGVVDPTKVTRMASYVDRMGDVIRYKYAPDRSMTVVNPDRSKKR